MSRKPYGVEPSMTLLQQVEELKREVRGVGYVLTTTESIEAVSGLNTLFAGKRVPSGVSKLTFRFSNSGAMDNLECRLVIQGAYNDYYSGFWYDGANVWVTVTLDDQGGIIQAIEKI